MKCHLWVSGVEDMTDYVAARDVELPCSPFVGMVIRIGNWAGAPEMEMGVEMRVEEVCYDLVTERLEVLLDSQSDSATLEASGFKRMLLEEVVPDHLPVPGAPNVQALRPKMKRVPVEPKPR